MKKIFRIALALLGKQNASSTIPLNLTLFCTKFLQVFEHFKKAIVNVESLS